MPGESVESKIARCIEEGGKMGKVQKVFHPTDRICPYSLWFEVRENQSTTTKSRQGDTAACKFSGGEKRVAREEDPQTKVHYRPCYYSAAL